jgi:hypothetical protein
MSTHSTTRDHDLRIGSWEAPGHEAGVQPHHVEVVIDTHTSGDPTICLESPDYCAMWDDLTADQARTLAAFLKVTLEDAADRLDRLAEERRAGRSPEGGGAGL